MVKDSSAAESAHLVDRLLAAKDLATTRSIEPGIRDSSVAQIPQHIGGLSPRTKQGQEHPVVRDDCVAEHSRKTVHLQRWSRGREC